MKPKTFFYYYNKKLYHQLKLISGIIIIYIIETIFILEKLDSKNNYKDIYDFIIVFIKKTFSKYFPINKE